MIHAIRVTLAAALLAALVVPAAAQTPAELLQKGIYAEETAGDLDGALKIFRQITASAPAHSEAAATAQYHIVQTLIQKGDLNGAATEFNILATTYSEHQALIAKLANRWSLVRKPAGVVQNGVYKNASTGVQLELSSPWRTTYDGPSSDDGEMVGLTDGSSIDYGVWMKAWTIAAADIPKKLQGSPAAKVKMNADITGFAFRPETIQMRTINGNQSLTGVADYSENGQRLVAIYIWVFTPKTHTVFIARQAPAADLTTAQSKLEQMVNRAVVP